MLSDDEMLSGFIDEAREHLSTIEPDLLELEQDSENMDTINRLFRSVHSVKGGAGFFGLEKMSALAHVMENLMSLVRTSKLKLTQDHIDALLNGLDKLMQMVDDPGNSNDLEIAGEVKLIESLSGAPPEKGEVLEVEGTSVSEQKPVTRNFQIEENAMNQALASGMNIYAVTVSLKKDLTAKNRTPFQFITELEELGQFIDSYLDIEHAGSLENVEEGELFFVFLFSTIMEPTLALSSMDIPKEQISLLDISEQEDAIGKAESHHAKASHQILENSGTLETEVEKQVEAPATPETEPVKEEPPVTPVEKTAPAAPKPSAPQAVKPAKAAVTRKKDAESEKTAMSASKGEESIRVGVKKLNKLVDLAGELVLVRNQIMRMVETDTQQGSGINTIMQNLNMVTSELQEEILNTRMQQISVVFGKFPRLIRELSNQLDKKIDIITEGNEVELDKTVIEALSDPLTHIIRNTADHGIEHPAERVAAGKPEKGKLLLKAYHESGQVIIQVIDDGGGIDADKVAGKAFEKGLISEHAFENMTNSEKINLVFLPGFSTAEQVSSVSGRGVGMDVVRSNIEKIGGTVEIQSERGRGTTVSMTLPLTMAIVSCLIVQAEKERFAIPQVNLEELVMLKPAEYKEKLGRVQNRDVLRLRGNLVPLISLSQGLNLNISGTEELPGGPVLERRQFFSDRRATESETARPSGSRDRRKVAKEAIRILIVNVGSSKIGVLVDSILGSEEIVVKPMPEYLKYLTYFSGATILGDGTIALILDTMGFVQKNNLMLKERTVDLAREGSSKSIEESQSLLIFDNATEEQFAITVPMIQRVDEINMEDIQHVGVKEYIEYRDKEMRILRIADYLPVQEPKNIGPKANIIIPKGTRVPVGLLINQVIDTQTQTFAMREGGIRSRGILGSTLIDKKITLILDLYGILEMGEPESIQKINVKKDVAKEQKILLAEDTPFFQTVLREYLSSVGLNVDVADDGVQAIELLEHNQYDLIVSDIEMPNMDGWELLRKIRENSNWKHLPVIAVTSLSDESVIKRGKQAGFDDWLVKLDKELMLKCMQNYLSI